MPEALSSSGVLTTTLLLATPHLLSGKPLIKFHCQLIDDLQSQYFSLFTSDGESTIFHKYSNISVNVKDHPEIIKERRLFKATPVTGLNTNVRTFFNQPEETAEFAVFVLFYDEVEYRLNDEMIVIGDVQVDEENKAFYVNVWYSLPQVSQALIHLEQPAQLSTVSENMKSGFIKTDGEWLSIVRNELKEVLTTALGSELAAEFLIIFLLSQTLAKVQLKRIGRLVINLIVEDESEVSNCCAFIDKLLERAAYCSNSVDFSLASLNKARLASAYDIETEQLIQGSLQPINKSHLFLKEVLLNQGTATEVGVRNLATLFAIVNDSTLNLDYPYSAVQIELDCAILIASLGKSTLRGDTVEVKLGKLKWDATQLDREEKWWENVRKWLLVVRNEAWASTLCKLNDTVKEAVQQHFVNERKEQEVSGDDLDRWLTIAKLRGISFGNQEISYDDYLEAVALEKGRVKK